MLDNQYAAVAKQIALKAKVVYHERVVRFVRRIKKNDVPTNGMLASREIFCGETVNFRLRFWNGELVEIFLDQCTGFFRAIDKRDKPDSARKRLDADRTGSSAEV